MKYKMYAKVLLGLLFSVLSLFALVGCQEQTRETVQNGIVLKDETLAPYPEELLAAADEVFSSLLEYYYTSVGENIDPTILGERALSLRRISEERPLTEQGYRALIELLDGEGEALVDCLCRIKNGESLDFSYLKEIYLAFTGTVGEEYLGEVTHSLALYLYDVKYERAMSQYEATGSLNQKIKAEKYLGERSVFAENIDKTDTCALLSTALFFTDLLVGGALSEGAGAMFSDEEILLFIQHIDLSALTVGRDGWLLLFDYLASYVGELREPAYGAKLFWSAIKNKNYTTGKTDGEALADAMPTFLAMFSAWQKSLTGEDISLIREGDFVALLENALSRMDETQREDFLSLCEVVPYRRGYEDVARLYFPDTYTEYSASVVTYTPTELLSAVGQESFKGALEGFLAYYCPAFSIFLKEG